MTRKVIAFLLSLVTVLTMMPMVALADSATVVTIGADLNEAQKEKMFQYFGVEKDKVEVIEVTNAEERQYLEGVATDAQIGRKTFSCAYIQETEKGNGINVKIANLNVVTSSMIATTLSTAGVYNCNVVAACPLEVSGTGALTGIMKAFEKVTGEKLDQEKKELATEELVTTAKLADDLNSDESATGIMTKVKDEVIKNDVKDDDDIRDIIKKVAKLYNIDLTDEQVEQILAIMKKVSKQNYDYSKIKGTLQDISSKAADKLKLDVDLNLDLKDISKEDAKGFIGAVTHFFKSVGDFFKGIANWFAGLFGGGKDSNDTKTKSSDNKNLGILNNTNDSLLGDNVIINSTDESTVNSDSAVENKEEAEQKTNDTNNQGTNNTDAQTPSQQNNNGMNDSNTTNNTNNTQQDSTTTQTTDNTVNN